MTLECLPQVITTRICNRYSKLNRYHEVLVKTEANKTSTMVDFGPKGRWVHTLREVLEDGQWRHCSTRARLRAMWASSFICLRPGESVWFFHRLREAEFSRTSPVRFWEKEHLQAGLLVIATERNKSN